MQLSIDGEGVEIYFSDLTPGARKELLELMGINSPADMNWDEDLQPIAFIPLGEQEENSDFEKEIDEEDEDLDEEFDEDGVEDEEDENENENSDD